MDKDTIETFIKQYVAMWNETDSHVRHKAVLKLWDKNAIDFTASSSYHGHKEIEARVERTNKKYIQEDGYIFRSCNNAVGNHNAIKFNWEMIAQTDKVASVGFDFLIFNEEGRIHYAYQYIER